MKHTLGCWKGAGRLRQAPGSDPGGARLNSNTIVIKLIQESDNLLIHFFVIFL